MKLEQEKQFIPTDDVLVSLLNLYGLVYVSHKAATSGIENTTLIIQTETGKIVARIYRQGKKSIEDIENEIDFMLYLANNGVKVPAVIKNTSSSFVTNCEYKNCTWQLIAMDFINGIHAKSYSAILIADMANTQAKIHNLSSLYNLPTGLGGLTVLRESYFVQQVNRDVLKNNELVNFLQRVENYELQLDPDLPKGLCHLDYDKDNIITKNYLIEAVLDFDDLELAPFVVCLGYTLCHVYMYGSEQMMQDYLAKYQETRTVNTLEKSYIKNVMLFRHYVISALKILNGHISEKETADYIDLEQKLIKLEVNNG